MIDLDKDLDLQLMIRAKEILSEGYSWTTGANAKWDEDHKRMQYCLLGAVDEARQEIIADAKSDEEHDWVDNEALEAESFLSIISLKLYNVPAVAFNDEVAANRKEVVKFLGEAIKRRKKVTSDK